MVNNFIFGGDQFMVKNLMKAKEKGETMFLSKQL